MLGDLYKNVTYIIAAVVVKYVLFYYFIFVKAECK